MNRVFRKIFGIYEGEWAHALRFVRFAYFWAFGSSCLDTLSDGFFLENIGASSLPSVYLTIALGMMGVSSIVLYSLKSLSPYRILTIAMGFGILFCLSGAFFALGSSHPSWLWYALKIGSRMFFAVMIAVSWTFIDQYHDLQDAKRVYSLYSAAYFLGTVLAGSMIGLFLEKFGFSALLLLAAGSIGAGLWEARKIAFRTKPIHDDSTEGVFSGSRLSFSSVVSLIFRSRFALVLLLLSLFIQLLITVTEFNYMQTFGAHFDGGGLSKGQIAEFLGKCRAWISICNIFVGIFFYSRFVRRLGLQNVILTTPLFFAAVYLGWMSTSSIVFALLGLIAVDGILFTIEDNCFNLLSNAVPSKLKSKVRIINDSFFEPIGMLISSLLLFLVQSKAKWLGLGLSLVVLSLTLILRSSYAKAILANLKDNAISFHRTFKGWLFSLPKREQKEAKREIYKALQLGSEEIQLLAAEGLLQLGDLSSFTQILQAAKEFGTMGKIEFLRLLEQSFFANDSRAIQLVEEWTDCESSPELAKWAQFYLAKRGFYPLEEAQKTIGDPDLQLRGAAILALSLEPSRRGEELAEAGLEKMLASSRIDELSMALSLLSDQEKIWPFLLHESVLVKRSAARSMARLASPAFASRGNELIQALRLAKDNQFRLSLLEAIGKIKSVEMIREILLISAHFRPNERRKTEEVVVQMGGVSMKLLLDLMKDTSFPEAGRILAAKILSRLALPELQAHFMEIIDIEIERAYFYFYFGHTIQKSYPLYDLKLLEQALLSGYQSVIDFIIHLLGAAGSLEDSSLLVRALHSKNAKIHSHAVESLERSSDVRLFRLLAPLIDDLPLQEKMAACLRWQGDFPKLTLSELLDKLEQSSPLFDKIVATRLKAQLGVPGWRQELKKKMKKSEGTFHQFASELLTNETL